LAQTVNVDVAIIGAGQAGLSLSHCLTREGIEHVVLERARIGESWRSERWSSFTLVTPNWSVRLAGREYQGSDPHGFMSRDELVTLLEDYAHSFAAPIESPVEIDAVHTRSDGRFELHSTQASVYVARIAVIATATHRHPRVPKFAAQLDADITQVHASRYRDPASLPAGTVLVVGSAQSGCQIADELNRAGREVVFATGRTGRLPRRYRGRDIIAWQRDMGFLDRPATALESPAMRFRADPHLTGQGGGRTLDLRTLSEQGVTLAGRLCATAGRSVTFDDDLGLNLESADQFASRTLHDVDTHIQNQSIAAPLADEMNSDLGYRGVRFVPAAPTQIDLRAQGINTVLWATGFRHDFSWVHAPVLDDVGYPIQQHGRTAIPGLHFLGLNYVDRRASGILYGAAQDAEQMSTVLSEHLGAR
jgi:putative flavoprotein involved in K+ transport